MQTKSINLCESIIAVLRDTLPPRDHHPLHEPAFEGNEWVYVKECLDTGWVSSVGQYVDRFEAALAEYTGVRRAVAMVNGTAALQVALMLAGVAAGDEVIVPAITFVGTANAVRHVGATPHFTDIEQCSLGIDPEKLKAHLKKIAEPAPGGWRNRETGARLAALVPVHVFGHPADMKRLLEVASTFNLAVVEDAAEALGSFIDERHVGSFGKAGVLSFNGNKILTTGGGGAILTNDEALADTAKHLTTTAKIPHPWAYVHDLIGYNFRLPNLNAALGCAQMELLPRFLLRKRALAEAYGRAFANMPGVRLRREPPGCCSNYWLNAIEIENAELDLRDSIIKQAAEAGFMTRPIWEPLYRLPMYANCPRSDISRADDMAAMVINIPSGPGIVVEVQ